MGVCMCVCVCVWMYVGMYVCVYPMLLMFAWPCASCIGRHAALMMPRLSLRRSLPVLSDGKQGWAGVERVCEERVCFAGASAE